MKGGSIPLEYGPCTAVLVVAGSEDGRDHFVLDYRVASIKLCRVANRVEITLYVQEGE